MNRLALLVCGLVAVSGIKLAAAPIKLVQKSVSSSRQFVIYCDDAGMRFAVSGYVEDTKSAILQLLGQQDRWKIPIVVNLLKPDPTNPGQPASEVHFEPVEGGSFKIGIDVTLQGDLAEAHFPQQLVKAILLELEYRNKPADQQGLRYIEPPQWLVAGLTVYLQTRGTTMDVDVYKTLLENNHLPSIGDFLSRDSSGLNNASLKLYNAYAVSLLELLKGLPDGKNCLWAYIQDLPKGKDAPSADLIKHFPALGGSSQSLEKWWTLSMAHISALNRFEGLSLEETEQHLASLLKITIPVGNKNETKTFPIDDYKQFYKLPGARQVLMSTALNLQNLSLQSSPLFRPVVSEYQTIAKELEQGKVKKTDKRLKSLAQYRELILHRMDQIDDYMNWFEATQMVLHSNSFDDYMKTANQLESGAPKRDDAVSHYLDKIELQMQ